MSNRQITIARILLLISIIIGIGIGIKIGIVSAKELTRAEHVNAKVHAHTAFEHRGQALVAHGAQAVHFDLHQLHDVNAA